MAKILIEEGRQNVAVNAVIAILAEEGEEPAEVANIAADEPVSETSGQKETAEPATPVQAQQQDIVINLPAEKTASPKADATALASANASAGRVFASPLARRIASDAGIDLAQINGTGPYGRIIRADVEEALAKTGPAAAASHQTILSGQQQASVQQTAAERFVPHNAMRRVIAERLQQSKQTAPHFYLTVECEIDTLLAARKALNEVFPEGVKISVNDMVVKASAAALMAVPEVNGVFEAEGCRYFSSADICIAVAVDDGLVTPVIRSAEKLGLAAIATASADLAGRARQGKLDPSEYAGGTFTISNLGMFGIREFSAVINPPQAAILAVGAGEKRPVVRDGSLAIATVMSVTLSADHRIVDGAVAARWMQAFKNAIENPVTMLL